jgi:ribosomal-protein-alanine acetyltransferase
MRPPGRPKGEYPGAQHEVGPFNSESILFRPMTEVDLPAVVALERSSQYTPWTEGNFRDALAAGNLCLVAMLDQRVAGIAVLQMAAGEAELLTMAIQPELRRRGMGRRLLAEIVTRAVDYGADAMWLDVRVSNAAAIALYRSAGFVEIGRRKDYYRATAGREDAMMMRLAMSMYRKDS